MDEVERDLIDRARQGDAQAFEQLVTPYDGAILAMARDMVGSLADAEDVYQEALLAAYRGLNGFRQESGFSTWLYRIAMNQALRYRSRRSRRRDVDGQSAPGAGTAAGAADDELLAKELRQQLDMALQDLSGQERTAFVLCHRQGLKIERAATVMACSAGAVKSYLFRGRDKVRKALASYVES